jgi:REP element-mobilizing transposase RayT
VINRGNYRRNLFEDPGAAEAFERTLGEAAVRFGWKVHAYVIMRNHFHLALQIAEPNLSDGMKWLQGTWARRHNGFSRAVGRPFQGRFKALLVEPGHALAQVCHYIHLNPARAKIVEPHELQNYRWSSLPKFEEGNHASWLEAATVLSDAGQLDNTPKGWLYYRSYLAFRSLEKGSPNELSRLRFSRGWCIGSDQFRTWVKQEFEDKGQVLAMARLAGLDREELTAEKEKLWLEQLTALAKSAKIDLDDLPKKKSAPEKLLLAAAMKSGSSVSNGWLASRLQMGQPATVSQFVRRFLVEPEQQREVERLLLRVKA